MNPVDNIAALVNELEVRYGMGMVFIFWLIFSFLFLALIFLLMTLLSRFAKDADARFTQDLNQYYEERLLGLLYGMSDHSDEQHIEEIKLKLKTRFQQQLLADIMVRLGKGLSGNLSDKVKQLYRTLQLHSYSLGKLKAVNWSIQASGISELREMHIQEGIPAIRELLNHRVALVRSHAQLALLELEAEGDRLSVFEQITYPLTDWDQLRLHESLKSRNGFHIESFGRLFSLSNHSIVLFAIRMSAFFGCSRDILPLQAMSSHPNVEIRTEAILALTRLGDYQLQEVLVDQFEGEETAVQHAILQYLMYTGYDRLSFFEQALTHPSHYISLQAARALAALQPAGFPEIYIERFAPQSLVIERIMHAADRRLQNA
ncbi:MAG: hypothetical protein C0424_07570 [Sphingobacteriaceae bacterium]|nr:hypothetical protein [Sphingobacteriaceae bacterium]